jgi:tetratricopeptide (TPR) repeat protein
MEWTQKPILYGILLFAVCVAAYIPAMRADFVWDDDDYIQNNQTLRTLKGLGQIWTEPKSIPQYYPLVHTTFWLEYQMWQLNPRGFHIANIILHGFSSVLLWRLLRFLSVPGAWIAAAIFAIHPVNVESIAWIAERKNVLSGLLYLASLLFYLKFDLRPRNKEGSGNWRLYVISLLFFIGALLSKTVTCSLPVAILLLLWWKKDKTSTIDIFKIVPFFAIGIVFALITVWLEKVHVGAEGPEWSMSFLGRCLTAGRIPWFYATKLLLPVNLMFVYPRWTIDASVWWQYLFPLALIMVLTILFFLRNVIGKGCVVGLLVFVGTLFPALSFIDVYPMRYSFVADHYQYLATPWFIATVVGCIVWLIRRYQNNMLIEAAAKVICVMILLTLGIATWQRCHVFLNLENLWLDTLAKNPGCWMAYNNMGKYLVEKGKIDKAIEYYQKSIEIRPKHATAIYNLGNAFYMQGQTEKAIEYLKRATELESDFAAAYYSLGNAYKKRSEVDEAILNYQKAIEINPDFYLPHFNLANTLKDCGQTDKAAYHYRETIRIKSDHGKAHYQLAMMIKSGKTIKETIEHLEKAEQLLPDSPLVKNELAWILATCPDPQYRNGQRALQLASTAAQQTNHSDPVILDTLAAAYAELGQFEKAISVTNTAIELTGKQSPPELANHLQEQMKMYKKGLACREELTNP